MLSLPSSAFAQYMWLDANGDGLHDSSDRLNGIGVPTTVDVYVDTDNNADGSTAVCDVDSAASLTIFSYVVALQLSNGTVAFSSFINRQTEMTFNIELEIATGTTYANGFGGLTPLAPGTYLLMTVTATLQTSTGPGATLAIVPGVPGMLSPTSFGTACVGLDFDNTYKLGTDWTDTAGLGPPSVAVGTPVVDNPGNRTSAEGQFLAYTVTATDPDAGQTLTFALGAGAPAGAAITTGGAFSWTPTEAQGPGSYPVTYEATDNGSPPLTGGAANTITVDEFNFAPIVINPGNRVGVVNALLIYIVTATDADLPVQALTFTLGPGAPVGTAITPGGVFTWTPTAAQAGNFPVTYIATDNGTPPLTGSATNTIGVGSTNTAPVVTSPANMTVDESSLLTHTVTATDPDAGQTLTFALGTGAPTGATITAAGAFSWTPSEEQGPGTYPVTYNATDNGTPPLSGSASNTITVTELNSAPVVSAPANQTVNEGTAVAYTVTATDSDVPTSTLTFTLGAGAPSGAAITGAGAFNWTPSFAQGPGIYPITYTATDNGTPPLSSSATNTITVDEVNLVPVLANPADMTVQEGTSQDQTLSAADADGDPLTFSLSPGAPAFVSVLTISPINATGQLIVSPPVGAAAGSPYSVTVIVSDGPSYDQASLSVTVTPAPALTLRWSNPAGGNWSDPSNWAEGRAPGPGDEVLITLDGTYTVNLDVDADLSSVYFGAPTGMQTLLATGRTIRIENTFQIVSGGVCVLSVSTIDGPGILANGGTLTAIASTINCFFENMETLRPGADLTVASGFSNSGLIEFVDGWSSLTLVSGILTNLPVGTIHVLDGRVADIFAEVDNQGALQVEGPLYVFRAGAAHTNSGTIEIAGGSLQLDQLSGGAGSTFTNTGLVSISAGQQFLIQGGSYQNDPPGRIQGTGTLNLSGTSFSNMGVIAPGLSPGILTFVGDVYLGTPGAGPGGQIQIELGGVTPGAEADQLQVLGNADLGGSLTLNYVNGFTPSLGDQFRVVTYQSHTGQFSSIGVSALPPGLGFTIDYEATGLTFTVVASGNLPPTVTAPPLVNTEEGGEAIVQVQAIDPDGLPIASLTADISALPLVNDAGFVVAPYDSTGTLGTLTWHPQIGDAGNYLVTFTAFDADTFQATTTTEIAVTPLGTSATGQLLWTPTAQEVGTFNVVFTATDADSESASATTEITVFPGPAVPPAPNRVHVSLGPSNPTRGPIISAPTQASVSAGQTLDLSVTAFDPDRGPIISIRANTSELPPGNTATFTTDLDPVVLAPPDASFDEGRTDSIFVSASDPDGNPIVALEADIASLPIGNNAGFLVAADNTSGLFTWAPTFADQGTYPVTFTAWNSLTVSATTTITVMEGNRRPTANPGGPYAGVAGVPLQLDGSASSDPDGQPLSYQWTFGDGASGVGPNPVHTYANEGTFAVLLIVSDGALDNSASTQAVIQGPLSAEASFQGGDRTIRLRSGKPVACARIEPLDNSFDITNVDYSTIVMRSVGTGEVEEIGAVADKSSVGGDSDHDGVMEIAACFAKADLRRLFSQVSGKVTLPVVIEGSLVPGGRFRSTAEVEVVGDGGGLSATLAPNPLNPDARLTIALPRPGPVQVALFDSRGRILRVLLDERQLAAGYHDVRVDGRDSRGGPLASGVYYYRVETPSEVATGRLVILR